MYSLVIKNNEASDTQQYDDQAETQNEDKTDEGQEITGEEADDEPEEAGVSPENIPTDSM